MYEVVDAGHHGGGKDVIKTEWKTIRTTFHNFESLPAQRGEMVSSPTLECHGLKWRVEVYPGGSSNSNPYMTHVSLFLRCESSKEKGQAVKAACVIRVPTTGFQGGTRLAASDGAQTFGTSLTESSWGNYNSVSRIFLLNSFNHFLFRGSLTIEVDIQVVFDNFPWATPTVPTSNTTCSSACSAHAAEKARLKEKYEGLEKNHASTKAKLNAFKYALRKVNRQMKPLSLDMLQLLESGDNADVIFEVGLAKKSFRAHRLILLSRCPTLALLTEDCDDGHSIPIEGVEPGMFRMVLRFVYGGKVPTKDILEKDAQTIIRAADRFGCTGLKLFAEAELASADISTDNAAQLILFADATNCALLKEAAMDKFVDDIDGVMASDGYDQVKESPAILAEMVAAMASANKKRPAGNDGDEGKDYKRMRVAALRKKLEAKGLDIDGSKEMLVSRLKEAEKDVVEVE